MCVLQWGEALDHTSSLYHRLYNYIKRAWTGVTSTIDSELEELESTPRYRPDSLAALCRATRFTEPELKRIYRGFKTECPTGVVKEETFQSIYSQFFPKGANTYHYARYIFKTLDQDRTGLLSFKDFVCGLSILSRGTLDEKLRWTFSLYDINDDGHISRDELADIVAAIYSLMGKVDELPRATLSARAEQIFMKLDRNRDGVITIDEFLECCSNDKDISQSMAMLESSF